MSTGLAFLSQTANDMGEVAVDRLSGLLQITRGELALAAVLSREAVSKTTRAHSQATQSRLREMTEILNRVRPWAGTLSSRLHDTGRSPFPPSVIRLPKPSSRKAERTQ
jgi:hypothetical protein